MERQWQENALTAEGRILHHRVDDPFFTEKRKGVVIARSVPVSSSRLGLGRMRRRRVHGPAGGYRNIRGRGASRTIGTLGTRTGGIQTREGAKQDLCDEAQLCAHKLCAWKKCWLFRFRQEIYTMVRPGAG